MSEDAERIIRQALWVVRGHRVFIILIGSVVGPAAFALVHTFKEALANHYDLAVGGVFAVWVLAVALNALGSYSPLDLYNQVNQLTRKKEQLDHDLSSTKTVARVNSARAGELWRGVDLLAAYLEDGKVGDRELK